VAVDVAVSVPVKEMANSAHLASKQCGQPDDTSDTSLIPSDTSLLFSLNATSLVSVYLA
jgi:hypothetical protein